MLYLRVTYFVGPGGGALLVLFLIEIVRIGTLVSVWPLSGHDALAPTGFVSYAAYVCPLPFSTAALSSTALFRHGAKGIDRLAAICRHAVAVY